MAISKYLKTWNIKEYNTSQYNISHGTIKIKYSYYKETQYATKPL